MFLSSRAAGITGERVGVFLQSDFKLVLQCHDSSFVHGNPIAVAGLSAGAFTRLPVANEGASRSTAGSGGDGLPLAK
jgi:hypothetical protein